MLQSSNPRFARGGGGAGGTAAGGGVSADLVPPAVRAEDRSAKTGMGGKVAMSPVLAWQGSLVVDEEGVMRRLETRHRALFCQTVAGLLAAKVLVGSADLQQSLDWSMVCPCKPASFVWCFYHLYSVSTCGPMLYMHVPALRVCGGECRCRWCRCWSGVFTYAMCCSGVFFTYAIHVWLLYVRCVYTLYMCAGGGDAVVPEPGLYVYLMHMP